jgi:lipoyl(octanoyl) transferase
MKLAQRANPVSVAEMQIAAAGLLDLGLTDYAQVYGLQRQLVTRRREGSAADDIWLLTEHRPVFTLGKRGGRESLLVSEEFLRARGVGLVQIERGGLITYHGPGQLVLYPIFHLREAGLTISDYVHLLEEVMLRLALQNGVVARRDERNHGIWVKNNKLGSIGIAIRHGITFHGLALNVEVDPEPFGWVNPCGLSGVSMTSLSLESGKRVTLTEVKRQLLPVVTEVFGRPLQRLTPAMAGVVAT